MSKQTYVRYADDDVMEILQDVVGSEVAVYLTPRCPCGCDAMIGYARDVRALWVFPQLWPEGVKPRVYGLETRDELERVLTRLKDKDQFEVVAPILREAFDAMVSA